MSNTYTGKMVKPTAEVGADVGRFVVNVGDGFYEIYIDQKLMPPALYNGKTESYPAAAGVHRVGVYCAGRWVIDTDVEVPDIEKEAPEQTTEPEKLVSVRADVLRVLFAQAMDISACLEALLAQEGE